MNDPWTGFRGYDESSGSVTSRQLAGFEGPENQAAGAAAGAGSSMFGSWKLGVITGVSVWLLTRVLDGMIKNGRK